MRSGRGRDSGVIFPAAVSGGVRAPPEICGRALAAVCSLRLPEMPEAGVWPLVKKRESLLNADMDRFAVFYSRREFPLGQGFNHGFGVFRAEGLQDADVFGHHIAFICHNNFHEYISPVALVQEVLHGAS